MNGDQQTITALATPPGRGGIAVVRLSGADAFRIGAAIIGRQPVPRQATLCELRDAEEGLIDRGIAIFFPGPRSFTGEDVVELQVHGGPVVSDWVLETALGLGARAAQPGEFTLRAFLNDKIDLAQAEAIADLVSSSSREAARAALRSLDGAFSQAVHALVRKITDIRVHIEAGIDFPDDEIDLHEDEVLGQRFAQAAAEFAQIKAAAGQGQVLRDGLAIVIAGPPNAGKSSLLNQLAGRESAIVTHVPGTTRDPLREQIAIDGMPLTVIDTAGLRESADVVEAEGIRRAHRVLGTADRALWVADVAQGTEKIRSAASAALPAGLPVTLILNKIDLARLPPGMRQDEQGTAVYLSALTGEGIDLLREHLKEVAGFQTEVSGVFSARRRHLDALMRGEVAFERGQDRFVDSAFELAAEDLRAAQQALGEITGEFTTENLLGEIFSSFCIGK